jgi:hypothetical protein
MLRLFLFPRVIKSLQPALGTRQLMIEDLRIQFDEQIEQLECPQTGKPGKRQPARRRFNSS